MHRNDEPTLRDCLNREAMVQSVGRAVMDCRPPMVFGIHGDWGAGKTSFLHQLHWYLMDECPESLEWQYAPTQRPKRPQDWEKVSEKTKPVVVWFEAWRYQHEPNAIVALLNEIRTQLEWHQRVWNKSKKLFEVGTYGALFSLESLSKHLGVAPSKVQEAGEKWERENYAVQLPTHIVRCLLEQAIGQLLGGKVEPDGTPTRKLVVLIDDLDRCEGDMAFRLLEGIKIYLNLPNCVFVVGMDQQIVQMAVQKHLPGNEEQNRFLAEEYIEKICRRVWYLPEANPTEIFERALSEVPGQQELCRVANEYECLPSNPRKAKALADTVRRFVKYTDYRGSTYDSSKWQGYITSLGTLREECDPVAGLLLTVASLYHFHQEIYRRLQNSPSFYQSLCAWADGTASDLPEAEFFNALDSPLRPITDEDTKTVLDKNKKPMWQYVYPETRFRKSFLVRKLIAELGFVKEEGLTKCFLGTAVRNGKA